MHKEKSTSLLFLCFFVYMNAQRTTTKKCFSKQTEPQKVSGVCARKGAAGGINHVVLQVALPRPHHQRGPATRLQTKSPAIIYAFFFTHTSHTDRRPAQIQRRLRTKRGRRRPDHVGLQVAPRPHHQRGPAMLAFADKITRHQFMNCFFYTQTHMKKKVRK